MSYLLGANFVCFSWVFLWEKAYQVRDTAIESSVMTKVKGFGVYNNRVMDVADYVTPTQVWHDGQMSGPRQQNDEGLTVTYALSAGRVRLLHHH